MATPTAWSKEEIYKLIEVWGDDSVQAQLNGCKRNQHVFSKISSELLEAGYERSAAQCRDKIKKLKGEYRKIKDKRNRSGEGRYSEWEYFDAIDNVLGHRPATKPPVVTESMGVDVHDEGLDEHGCTHSSDLSNDDIPSTSTRALSASKLQESAETPPPDEKQSKKTPPPDEKQSKKTPPPEEKGSKKRKRPKSSMEKMEAITTAIIDKLTEMQKSSDSLVRDLEEKRLKYEERQAEREERQRQEERQFQLQMLQMMVGHPPSISSNMHAPQFPYGTMHSFPPFQDDD